jgi:hypothetical protein
MKRLHVHAHLDDLAASIACYARLFGADAALLDEGATTCCYARSEKHWLTDPQGIAWEHYRTLGDIPVFREAAQEASAAACCTPAAQARPGRCC